LGHGLAPHSGKKNGCPRISQVGETVQVTLGSAVRTCLRRGGRTGGLERLRNEGEERYRLGRRYEGKTIQALGIGPAHGEQYEYVGS